MSSVVIAGDTSGSITLEAPAIAGSTVLTLPAVSGTLITSGGGYAGSFTSLTDSGNLTFTGTGNRITGDFSNATIASKVSFQSSTVNGGSYPQVLPNGTNTNSGFLSFNNSDPTNAGYSSFLATSTDARLVSGITGTGTYLPMTFYTGGSERMRIDTSGNVGIGLTPAFPLNVQSSSTLVAGSPSIVLQGSSNTERIAVRSTVTPVFYAGFCNGTIASPTAVTSGNFLGGYQFGGYAATLWTRGAQIAGFADGTWTDTSNPSYITFQIVSSGSTTLTERMRIDSSGNVGIGTGSPNSKLGIVTTAATAAWQIRVSNSGISNDSGIYADASNNMEFAARNGSGTLTLRLGSSGDSYINAGNVGIGTSSPSTKLNIVGGVVAQYKASADNTGFLAQVGDTSNSYFRAQNSTNTCDFVQSNGIAFINAGSSQPFALYTSGTERMRIDASGRITTPANPAFQVSGTTSPVSSGSKVPWTNAKFNRGNCFDTANSRFTAPVSGIYWMSVSLFITTTNSPARPSFRVNGSDYSVGFDAAQTVTNVTGAEITNILSLHMTLNAGDYVEVFARTGGGSLVFYQGHSWWSGNLIG